MTTGSIGVNGQAMLPVSILNNRSGQFVVFNFVIDTGFSGDLQLPADDIARLNLLFLDRTDSQLADGRTVRADVYSATVLWLDHRAVIKVISANENIPLIGTNLLWGSAMAIEWEFGGRVTVVPIPEPE